MWPLPADQNNYVEELIRYREAKIQAVTDKVKDETVTPPLPALLSAALVNEWEAAHISSIWAKNENHLYSRVAYLRLSGDEAKHFSWILEMRGNLGVPPDQFNPPPPSPLFQFLQKQKNSFARAITGPFTRESIAVKRNQIFLEFCERGNHLDIAKMYRNIQSDEQYHLRLGEVLAAHFVNTPVKLKRAKRLISQELELVEEIQEMAVLKKGLCNLPGC